ncbi:hypothetical protein D3C80_1803010 [compost metagenome]
MIVQHAECIEEPFAVAELIAHAIHGDNFPLEIQRGQLWPNRFPVFLKLTEIPGWHAEDQDGVLFHQLGGNVFQVVQVDQVFT